MARRNAPKMEMERTGPNSARAAARYPVPVGRLREAVHKAVGGLARWETAGPSSFVRTTRFLRFKDDVTVEVTEDGEGSRLSARSASRVGKSDLGQNPRNLRELFAAVERELDL